MSWIVIASLVVIPLALTGFVLACLFGYVRGLERDQQREAEEVEAMTPEDAQVYWAWKAAPKGKGARW
jgi:hypothetical protein